MDVEVIEGLVKVLADSAQLTELEVRQGNVTLRLRRPMPSTRPPKKAGKPTASQTAAATQTVEAPSSVLTGTVVVAELVGVFHARRQEPISVGDVVKPKQVLGQIESMRLMNDCAAPVGGRVQAVLVQDGQPVEYGQPLFEIVPEETA